jgi:hypothetical protein
MNQSVLSTIDKTDNSRQKGREKYNTTVGRPEKSLSVVDNDLPNHNQSVLSTSDKTEMFYQRR